MNSSPLTGNTYRLTCLLLLAVALIIPCATALTLSPGSTSSIATIAQGDPVYISGIATGQPQVGLQIWFIGNNFAKVTSVQVNNDDTYQYDLQGTDTANLASGQYFVLVQHPMENGRFDVVYDTSSGMVKNVVTGKDLYQFSGSGSLQSPASATALVNAIASQDIDDTFALTTFMVSPPAVSIVPIGNLQQGGNLTINGTTSLAAGDNLLVNIISSTYTPAEKTQPTGFSGAGGMVTVMPGSGGKNFWSFTTDASSFTPGEYLVTVSGIVQSVTASTSFTVECNSSGETCSIPALVSTTVTPSMPPVTADSPTSVPVTSVPATTTISSTTQSAPVPVALCLGSIAVVFLFCRRT